MEGKCEWTKTVELPNPKYKGNKYEVCKLKKSEPQSQTSPNLNPALDSDDEFLFNYIKKLPDTKTLFEKNEKIHYISASIKLFNKVNTPTILVNNEFFFIYIDDIRTNFKQFQTFMTNIKTSLLQNYISQLNDGIYLLRFTEKHPLKMPIDNAYTNNKDDLLKRLKNTKVITEDTFKTNIATHLSLDDNEKKILNREMQSLLDWINVAEKFINDPMKAASDMLGIDIGNFGGKTNYKQTPKRVHLSDSRPNAIIFQYPPSKIQYVKVKGHYLKIADAKKFLRKCI